MIELRNRIRIALAISPLLLGVGCMSPPEKTNTPVETAQSALVHNSTLSLKLMYINRGDTFGTLPPDRVALEYLNFTSPPNTTPFGGLPGSVDFGTQCTGPTGGTQSCVTPPTGAWTKSFTYDSNAPQTNVYTGVLVITPQGSGVGSQFRPCFQFGLNTSTLKLAPVAATTTGCNGGSDVNDTVTCDATTCTATLNLSGRDSVPWHVKFSYSTKDVSTVASGTLTPAFFITNVYYPPPAQSSNIKYEANTTIGTTTSTTKGFTKSVTVTAKGGIESILFSPSVTVTGGTEWGTTRTDETDISITKSAGYTKNGQVDGIDHSYDEIWFLIRPKLSVSITQVVGSTAPPALTWNFTPNQDGRTNAVPAFVYAGWLTGAVPWDAGVQQQLAAVGIDSNYYPELLKADPLAMGTISDPAQNPNRYHFIGSHPYVPLLHEGDMPDPQEYGESQNTTTTSTTEENHDYTAGLTVEGELTFLNLIKTSLSVEGTLKWTNSSSKKETKGTGTTDTLTIGQPAFGYQGPNFVFVYEDRIYKTYAFSLNGVCGSGATTQFCNTGGTPQCIWTRWGFEPGEQFSFANSAENMASSSTVLAHGGTHALAISAPDDPTIPSRVDNLPCFTSSNGSMDLAGKTFSAWVLVANSASSYAGTSCRLRAFDKAFNEATEISTSAVRSPIFPGAWFQLTGTFGQSAVDHAISELTVECKLPTDWTMGNTDQVWYLDDVTVQ